MQKLLKGRNSPSAHLTSRFCPKDEVRCYLGPAVPGNSEGVCARQSQVSEARAGGLPGFCSGCPDKVGESLDLSLGLSPAKPSKHHRRILGALLLKLCSVWGLQMGLTGGLRYFYEFLFFKVHWPPGEAKRSAFVLWHVRSGPSPVL